MIDLLVAHYYNNSTTAYVCACVCMYSMNVCMCNRIGEGFMYKLKDALLFTLCVNVNFGEIT